LTNGEPLCHAAHNGRPLEVLQCLVNDIGADVNQSNDQGWSLICGNQSGQARCGGCLLKLRADVNQADKDGITPLMIASMRKHEEVVVWLIKAGADTQATLPGRTNATAADASRELGASTSQTAYLEAKTHCPSPDCSGAGLKKCPACKQVRYCGEPCQLAHWKAHKADCKRWSAELGAAKGKGKGKG
jgi:hypothetical protein